MYKNNSLEAISAKSNIREVINKCSDYFINYSFDDIEIDIISIQKIDLTDNIFSIHTADELAVYVYVSDECNQILGYKQSFIIGKCLYSFLHNDDLENVVQINDSVSNGENLETSFRLRTNFKSSKGIQYQQLDTSIKKVDNLIVTYIKPPLNGYHLADKNRYA